MMGYSMFYRRVLGAPVLAALVCVFALSGCGGGDIGSEPSQIGRAGRETDQAFGQGVVASANSIELDRWAAHSQQDSMGALATPADAEAALLGQGARLNQETLEKALALRTAGLETSEKWAGAVAKSSTPVLVPAYRFFNTRTSAHFYTISATERDQIGATAPWYNYEGVAFQVSAGPQSGLAPVYRFFNAKTGVHFYTISESEKALIVANLPSFKLEGVAYYASLVPGAGMAPLYRFFRQDKGFHFYTAQYAERDATINTNCAFRYEGPAYYIFDANAVTNPPPAPVNATVLIVGDSLAQGYGYDIGGDYYGFVSPGQVWTQRLSAAITSRTGRICNRVVDVSVGGMRTEHGLAKIQSWLDLYAPTHVILAQGTNDAWQGSPLATIQANIAAMALASSTNNRHVYVMDYSFYRNGPAYRQSLSAAYQAAAVAGQASYFLGTANVPGDSNYYYDDTVHLKDLAEPLVFEKVWQTLQTSL